MARCARGQPLQDAQCRLRSDPLKERLTPYVGVVLLLIALAFLRRSFYGMRIRNG
jgi:hypothetical protein